MLVHKGGQINNVQSIAGVGSAEMSNLQNCGVKIFKEHCRYFTIKKNGGGGGGRGAGKGGPTRGENELRLDGIVQFKNKQTKQKHEGWWLGGGGMDGQT